MELALDFVPIMGVNSMNLKTSIKKKIVTSPPTLINVATALIKTFFKNKENHY